MNDSEQTSDAFDIWFNDDVNCVEYARYMEVDDWVMDIRSQIEGAIFLDLIDWSESDNHSESDD